MTQSGRPGSRRSSRASSRRTNSTTRNRAARDEQAASDALWRALRGAWRVAAAKFYEIVALGYNQSDADPSFFWKRQK